MIGIVDVDYRDDHAWAACVLAEDWTSPEPSRVVIERVSDPAPYTSGEFWRRELPCLLAVLARVGEQLEAVVVDAHAWLGPGAPGLGARLHEALGGTVPVVGIAKTAWNGSHDASAVVHGTRSVKPVYVTAAGIPQETAARLVAAMHGPYRIPTLLKTTDRACREAGQ